MLATRPSNIFSFALLFQLQTAKIIEIYELTMAQDAASHPLALPPSFSPDSIDALAELSLVVSRLKPVQGAGPANTQNSQTASSQTQGAGPSQPTADPLQIPQTVHPLLPDVSNIGDLPLRDVARFSDEIKHKLQRARQQIRQLPDMGRTIAEQEEEIKYLKKKMADQRKVLETLRNIQLKPSTEMEM